MTVLTVRVRTTNCQGVPITVYSSLCQSMWSCMPKRNAETGRLTRGTRVGYPGRDRRAADFDHCPKRQPRSPSQHSARAGLAAAQSAASAAAQEHACRRGAGSLAPTTIPRIPTGMGDRARPRSRSRIATPFTSPALPKNPYLEALTVTVLTVRVRTTN